MTFISYNVDFIVSDESDNEENNSATSNGNFCFYIFKYSYIIYIFIVCQCESQSNSEYSCNERTATLITQKKLDFMVRDLTLSKEDAQKLETIFCIQILHSHGIVHGKVLMWIFTKHRIRFTFAWHQRTIAKT